MVDLSVMTTLVLYANVVSEYIWPSKWGTFVNLQLKSEPNLSSSLQPLRPTFLSQKWDCGFFHVGNKSTATFSLSSPPPSYLITLVICWMAPCTSASSMAIESIWKYWFLHAYANDGACLMPVIGRTVVWIISWYERPVSGLATERVNARWSWSLINCNTCWSWAIVSCLC